MGSSLTAVGARYMDREVLSLEGFFLACVVYIVRGRTRSVYPS